MAAQKWLVKRTYHHNSGSPDEANVYKAASQRAALVEDVVNALNEGFDVDADGEDVEKALATVDADGWALLRADADDYVFVLGRSSDEVDLALDLALGLASTNGLEGEEPPTTADEAWSLTDKYENVWFRVEPYVRDEALAASFQTLTKEELIDLLLEERATY